jgi:hypothetical protein
MIERASIAYFTRTVLALRKKLTSSRQGPSAARLEDVAKVGDDLGFHLLEVAVGDPVGGVAQRLYALAHAPVDAGLHGQDDRRLRHDDA